MLFSYSTPIFLYGYNNFSITKFNSFIQNDYNIQGIIDKNANSIDKVPNIPIIGLNELDHIKNSSSQVAFVCLSNIFLHDEVAELLYNAGFKKIVFLPVNDELYDYNLMNNLRLIYNNFAVDNFEDITEIPDYEKLKLKEGQKEYFILNKHDMIVPLPVEIIFSVSKEYLKMDLEEQELLNQNYGKLLGADQPILSNTLHMKLMGFWTGKILRVQDYLNMKSSFSHSNEKNKILKNRYDLYSFFSKELDHGMDFFVCSAGFGKWNKKGYFNLNDGNHRAAFLLQHGINIIPVRISKEDYTIWVNEKKCKKLQQYLLSNPQMNLEVSIPHPHFYNFPSVRKNGGNIILKKIYQILEGMDLSAKTILDLSNFQGFFARNMARCTSKIVYSLEENLLCAQLQKHINELLYTTNVLIESSYAQLYTREKYDIIFHLGHIKDYSQKKGQILEFLNTRGGEIMFWESQENAEQEIKELFKIANYKRYQKLLDSYNGNNITEIGVLWK